MLYDKQKVHFKPLSFFLVLSLLNLTGCARTTPYRLSNFFIADSINELKQKRIAVLPFENLTANKQASLLVTDEFNLQLGKIGKFDLVERIKIDELFKEQDFPKDRIDEATAVKIGKMLGAQAVVLGVITKYQSGEQEKQVAQSQQPAPVPVVIGDRGCHKEEEEDEWDWLDTVIFVGAVVTVVGAVYILFLQPSAEVGISVRMINVETGQQLWQARDTFKGNWPSIKSLVKTKEERKRLRKDVDFLTRLLCQKLAETLK
ncbi:MAG: CsgG/HfaB family protein [bacterium]|nr:CsgG/HfaB family protein [bacterium]